MKIVISPAKSLNYESPLPISNNTEPSFLSKSETIQKTLKKKKPKQLMELMDISEKLAELNWQRNQEWSVPFSPENARPAVYAFDGDVYTGLDVYSLPTEKVAVLQEKLRILSGLYGLLKPLDLMQPYRLEMGTSIAIGTKKNLYDFWKKTITDTLNCVHVQAVSLIIFCLNHLCSFLIDSTDMGQHKNLCHLVVRP